jgi:hypothetical protein
MEEYDSIPSVQQSNPWPAPTAHSGGHASINAAEPLRSQFELQQGEPGNVVNGRQTQKDAEIAELGQKLAEKDVEMTWLRIRLEKSTVWCLFSR